MRTSCRLAVQLCLAIGAVASAAGPARAAGYTLLGWNNLGMHCMDGDYGVLSLLPPFNTIDAQLIDPEGRLVDDPVAAGIVVTYEAIADADGSINTTAAGKTNFWSFVDGLFGVALPVDAGLAGKSMPGPANVPQPMTWDPAAGWFEAAGIPITPYDDAGNKNPYPMMRLVARNAQGNVLATTDIVLPVSDEMDCRACHASGSGPAARPASGWAFDSDAQRDMRLNILRLHDERELSDPLFQSALLAAGYAPTGLEQTVVQQGRSILCANCHLSEALPGSGRPGIAPLTQAIHGLHAGAIDPLTGTSLGDDDNRAACYRCHPGSVTRCLRGAMGSAVASDGTLAMQCQSCHGSMSEVADADRVGWLDEPTCQSCHTGTATVNAGQIRFTSVFDAPGHRRVAPDPTFATTPNAPAPGLSLYRFSTGHGGLACESCHGSTHAEFPASHRNDNVQSIQQQGHGGMMVECVACHDQTPRTVAGGPHGMHPVGQDWVESHHDEIEHGGGTGPCRTCHGADYRGTVLSRAQASRTLHTDFGTKSVWRGFQVGCFLCHRGPTSEAPTTNHAPVVQSTSGTTSVDAPLPLPITAQDADGDVLVLRVVNQPEHGTAGLVATTATYHPEPGFHGSDAFTVAAWDGSSDSNLATVTVTVGGSGCTGPDLDGDGIPNACDPEDAALTDVTASLRAVRGSVRTAVSAAFSARGPSGAFDASSGLTITVRDATSVAEAATWSTADCTVKPRGTIRCVTPDGLAIASFRPGRADGDWRFRTSLRRAGGLSSPPSGPATVVVTHGASIDRVGRAARCRPQPGGLTCRK